MFRALLVSSVRSLLCLRRGLIHSLASVHSGVRARLGRLQSSTALRILHSLCSNSYGTICVFSYSPDQVDSDPLLRSATAEILQDKLCNREQHGFFTPDFFHRLFVVYGNYLRHYVQSCNLIIVFSTLFVLVFFSSVICSRFDILCIFSTSNWYVLSLF